jgi:hypothetical protein
VVINSAYRSLELNRALKSKDTSQHILGQAIDGEALKAGNYEVAAWIRDNLEFDQLILEFYDPTKGARSGWVHCSYVEGNNRNEVLTINSNGVFTGLLN